MRLAYHLCLIVLFIYPQQLWAQEDSYAKQLEDLFAEMDSMSIFNLIDSTLAMGSVRYSELNIRATYSSNVAVAGRNYGINQHGFSPGVSYYHKSGFFGDVTGYWNSAYDPSYSLTMLSAGYFGIKKNFTYVPSYERWIYNDDESATLHNSLGLSLNQRIKFLSAGVDYSYLFGPEHAHRLIFSLNGYISFKNVWFFDAISIMPNVSALFGSSKVTTLRFTSERTVRNVYDENLYYISQGTYSEQKDWLLTAFRKVRQSDLSTKWKLGMLEYLNSLNNNLETYGTILSPAQLANFEENSNPFGLMNWNFSIPVIFTIDHFNISIFYSYNIPKALPGEEFDFDPISYYGASVTYRIPFKH
ncbi:MAG: hypothetical protein ACFHWX_10490 [Bacteroidota bacterium]